MALREHDDGYVKSEGGRGRLEPVLVLAMSSCQLDDIGRPHAAQPGKHAEEHPSGPRRKIRA